MTAMPATDDLTVDAALARDAAAFVPLNGRSAYDYDRERFSAQFNAACSRVAVTAEPGRQSLTAAFVHGYLRAAVGDVPGWVAVDPDPWVLTFLGMLSPDDNLPDDPGYAIDLTNGWIRQLDAHGVNDRLTAFHDAAERVMVGDNPHGHNELAALIIETAGDELCCEPLPAHLNVYTLVDASLERARPAADFVLPVPGRPGARWARIARGCETFAAGTFGARLNAGFAHLAANGMSLPTSASASLLPVVVAVGYHPDVFDINDDASLDRAAQWAWVTGSGTTASKFLDIATELSSGTIEDVLRYGAVLYGLTDDIEQLPADRGALPTMPYGPRSRNVPQAGGDRLLALAPEPSAALGDYLQQAQAQFRTKFGRDMGPDDPLFFDPDADVPTAIDPDDYMRRMVALLEEILGPDAAYASLRVGGRLVTEENMHLIPAADVERFDDGRQLYATAEGLAAAGQVDEAITVALECAADDLRADELDGACFLYDTLAADWWRHLHASERAAALRAYVAIHHGPGGMRRTAGAHELHSHYIARLPEGAQEAVTAALTTSTPRTADRTVAAVTDPDVAWWAAVVVCAGLSASEAAAAA